MKELLQKIIIKAYEITMNTKHDVFVDYAGHVNGVHIFIYEDGWKPNKEMSFSKDIYLNIKNTRKELEKVLDILEEYYKEGVKE